MGNERRGARDVTSEQSQISALVPTTIVLEDEAFDRLVASLEKPAAPTKRLRELMRGKDR